MNLYFHLTNKIARFNPSLALSVARGSTPPPPLLQCTRWQPCRWRHAGRHNPRCIAHGEEGIQHRLAAVAANIARAERREVFVVLTVCAGGALGCCHRAEYSSGHFFSSFVGFQLQCITSANQLTLCSSDGSQGIFVV